LTLKEETHEASLYTRSLRVPKRAMHRPWTHYVPGKHAWGLLNPLAMAVLGSAVAFFR
jgi:hypothetical protein